MQMKQNTQAMNKNRIGLVMIVKNESSVIQRCLSNTIGVIDEYLIVDTGSTDNTIQLIKDFFAEYPEIKGQVVSSVWKNFGYNRTESLKFAKELLNVEWLLTIDADMILVNDGFDKSKLDSKIGAYQFYQKNGTLKYANVRLMNNKYNWQSIGVTHEFLSSEEDSRKILEQLWINDIGDGGAKGDKFERDIKLLEQGLIDEPNNVRYMFYLANSYKDTQQWEKAIKWYNERIKRGGWIEEVTCSYEYLGKCYEGLGKLPQAVDVWMEGYEKNPHRAECLYNAIRVLRIQKKNHIAYHLLELAKKIPFPKNDVLFVNHNVYDHLIDTETTILAYYADPNRDVRGIFKELIANPKAGYSNLISNYKFYCKSIESFKIKEIDIYPLVKDYLDADYYSSSPCIIKDNDNFIINVRNVSYHLYDDGSYKEINSSKTKGNINTLNIFLKLDDKFNVIERKAFEIEDYNQNRINGIEDIKLINHNGKVYFTGTKWLTYNKIEIATGLYDTNLSFLNYNLVPSPLKRNVEKNWVPFVFDNELLYIYDWNPIAIGKIENTEFKIIKQLPKTLHNFRGSTPGYEYDGIIYFLVHCVEYSMPRHYYHSIVKIDAKTLEYIDHSILFTFNDEKIEYALGLIIEEKNVIISHSKWDKTSQIKFYEKEKLFSDIFPR